MYPEEHCKKAIEMLKEINANDDLIHTINILFNINIQNLMSKGSIEKDIELINKNQGEIYENIY